MSDDASTEEVRAAYRRLIREVHPDVAGAGGSGAAEANEAYRVLVDPSRRSAYDLARRDGGTPTTTTGAGSTNDPSDDRSPYEEAWAHDRRARAGERRVPWRAVVLVLAFAAAGVVVLSWLTEPDAPRPPDGVLEAGSCVSIESNGDAREVACSGADDVVVQALVPFGGACPQGTLAHRDRQGLGMACVAADG